MNKILGIFGLLLYVCLFTTLLSDSFDSPQNLFNLTRWSALYGIISIGAVFVIITGGIDLSIGSVVCLVGGLLATFIMDYGWSIYSSIAVVMLVATSLGCVHGLLITKLKLQPFVVTLGGFLIYRGFSRWFFQDRAMGFGQVHDQGIRQLAIGKPWIGYEQNLALLLAIAGMLFAVFHLFQFLGRYQTHASSPDFRAIRRKAWMGIGFGALFAFAGFSQFLGGEATQVLRIASYPIPLTPASLLRHLGLVLFVPVAATFFVAGLWSDWQKNFLPSLALVVSTFFFMGTLWYIAPSFQDFAPRGSEVQTLGLLKLSEGALRNVVMVIAFVSTGCLMAAIGWLASNVVRTSETGKLLFPVVVTSGVMWLLGMTKLANTLIPMPLLILIGCGIVASVLLNQTIFGRYLLALGRNEEAARYSGINTDRMTIFAYMICSGMAGIGAILFALDINNMQPANHGNIYELYAIAAAVLGGCSLRGGEGTILGVVIGAAVMRVLYNAINTLGIDTKLEYVVIGLVILAGAIADELIKRLVAAKRRKMQLAE